MTTIKLVFFKIKHLRKIEKTVVSKHIMVGEATVNSKNGRVYKTLKDLLSKPFMTNVEAHYGLSSVVEITTRFILR